MSSSFQRARLAAVLIVTLLVAATTTSTVSGQGGTGLRISPPNFELEAEPGQTVAQQIRVSNRGDGPLPIAMQVAGFTPWSNKLILYYVTRVCIPDPNEAGGRRYKEGAFSLNACVTSDGTTWETYPELLKGTVWMFEAPRLTRDGTWLAGGTVGGPAVYRGSWLEAETAGGPVVYRWPQDNPLGEPEIVPLREHDSEGVFPAGEASWYQTDEGRIWMYWRDEGGSLRLYVSVSDDDGKTWVGPLLSDFPDSVSRVRVGRLPDDRYFLIGNSYPHLYDRGHLMISLSDDGEKFTKMYTLIDDPTAQRVKGLLKQHGYQYPCSVVDGDRLLVAYSVNKEDIECGIVDTSTPRWTPLSRQAKGRC